MIPSNPIGGEHPLRPSTKEVGKKLRAARELVRNDKWRPANPPKLQVNWDEIEQEFGIDTTLKSDQTDILIAALDELRPENYVGSHPPEPSYEAAVKDEDMWEFRWISSRFGKEMYLKFCLKGDANSQRVYMLSIHPNRPI